MSIFINLPTVAMREQYMYLSFPAVFQKIKKLVKLFCQRERWIISLLFGSAKLIIRNVNTKKRKKEILADLVTDKNQNLEADINVSMKMLPKKQTHKSGYRFYQVDLIYGKKQKNLNQFILLKHFQQGETRKRRNVFIWATSKINWITDCNN